MALMGSMLNMRKLNAELQSGIQAHIDTKTTETKSHVTSKNTETKNLVTSENDDTQATLASMATGTDLNANTTNVNSHTSAKKTELTTENTANKDEIKTHVTSELNGLSLSPVKSIQRGFSNLLAGFDVTVSAVDVSKCVLNTQVETGWLYKNKDTSSEVALPYSGTAYLSSSTNIHFYTAKIPSGFTESMADRPRIYWELIEYA